MPDPKKPWEKNYSVENTESQELKPWEKNYVSDTEKKNPIGTSSSPGKNSELVPTTGSSAGKNSNGFPKIDSNSVAPNFDGMKTNVGPTSREAILRKKLANTKVTSTNMDEVSADTDELQTILKSKSPNAIAIKKQEELKKEPDFLEKYQNFKNNTSTVTDDDIVRAKEEFKSEIDDNQWADYLREGAKKAVNNVVKFANTPMDAINRLGGNVPTIPLMDKKNPLEKNLKQADDYFLQLKKEARSNKDAIPTFTKEQRLEKAKELFIKEKTDSYLYSRQKDYLQEQDDQDGGVLQSKFADFKKGELASLDEKEKTLLNKQAVQEVTHSRLKTEIENLQEKAKNTGLTPELIQAFDEKLAQYKQVEADGLETINQYVSNRKNIGNATDNLDVFKRNYGLWKNIKGNVMSSAEGLASGAFGALDYGMEFKKNITGTQSPSEIYIQNTFKEASKDIQNLSKKTASEIEKPMSVENINSWSDFGDWLVNDAGAKQVPIYAMLTAGGFGVAGIGVTSLGTKYEEMQGEVQRGEKKYSTTEMMLHPVGYGLAETASAAVDLAIMRNAGRVLASASAPERRMIAKGFWEKAKDYGKELGKQSLKGGVFETLDETGTKGAQNLIDGKPFTKGMLDAGAAGGAMGFLLPFLAVNYKHTIKPFTTDSKIQKGSAEILQLQSQLDNPNLDNETKAIIKENLDKTKIKVEGLVKKVVGNIKSLSNEQFQEIVRNEKTQANIRTQAEKIQFDDNLDEGIKKQLLNNLQEEFKANDQRRLDLLDRGANVQLEQLEDKDVVRLKDQASRELMKEQNPDGTASITLNDNDISKRAVEIHKQEIADKANAEPQTTSTEPAPFVSEVVIPPVPEDYNIVDEKPKTEGNSPLLPSETQQNGSEAEVNLPQNENIETAVSENQDKKPVKMDFSEEEKAKVQKKVVNKPRVILRSGKVGTDAFFALPNEGVFGEVVDKVGNDENVTAYRYPKDFKIKDLSNDVVFDEYMSKKMFEETRKEGYDAAYVMEIDGSKVLHVINPQKLTLLDEKLPELRNNETISTTNTAADGNVRSGASVVEQNGTAEPKNTTTESIPESVDGGEGKTDAKQVTTKKVKSIKDVEYDVDFDHNGNVVEIRSPKDGRSIPKFVERKVKPSKQNPTGKILSKNANYSKIEADAKGELTNNQQNEVEKLDKKIQDEKIRAFEPNNEYEIALKYVAEGGKVRLSSARSETGEKNAKSMKWASVFNKEVDLPTIENVAEQLIPYDSHLDESLIRKHLIDIYSTFENQNAVKNHLLDVYEENTAKKQEQELHAFLGSLSEKDFAMYQAIQAEDSYIEELSDKEFEEYYNQKLDENEQGQREYARQETANERSENIAKSNEGEKGSGGSQEQKSGEVTEKTSAEQLLDWLDEMENNLDQFGKESLSMGIPIVIAKGAIKAMRVAVKAGKLGADVFQAGLDAVKQSEWFKNLTKKEQQDIENDFEVNFVDKIKEKKNLEDSFEIEERTLYEKTIDRIVKKFQDKLINVRNLQKGIEKFTGRNASKNTNFSQAEIAMHGKASNDLLQAEKTIEKLGKDIGKYGFTSKKVSDYIYAKHAKERNQFIKENVDTEKNDGSGMSDEKANEILSSFTPEEIVNLEKLNQQVLDIVENTRNNYVKFGLESQENVDALKKQYKNYVPLTGFAEDELNDSYFGSGGSSINVKGKENRSASGRTTKADNVIANVIRQNSESIIRGRKNEVLEKLYNLAKENPNNAVWKVFSEQNPDTERKFIRKVKSEEKENTNEDQSKLELNEDVLPAEKKSTGQMQNVPIQMQNNDKYVGVKINGQQHYIKFENSELGKTLNGVTIEKSNFLVRALMPINNFLSRTLTSYNPEFVPTNFTRDIQTAIYNLLSEQDISKNSVKGKELVAKTIKGIAPSMKAIYQAEKGKNVSDPKYGKYYEEFKEDGAKTGWFYTKDPESLKNDIDYFIKLQQPDLNKAKTIEAIKSVGNFVENINSSVENAVRLSTYISAREAGVTREDAGELAKELTVNFNKKGDYGQVANAFYLFFNAGVQGTARFAKAMGTLKRTVNTDGTVSKSLNRAQKIAIGTVVVSGLLTLLNQAMSDDDDDEKSFYSKIPDYEKERNMIIMDPRDGKNYFKIPLPYGYNIFNNIGTAIAEVSLGNKSVGDAMGFLTKSLLGAFSPVGFGESKDFEKQAVKTVTPTALKPVVEMAVNENYFGSTIYNENYSFGTPKPDSDLGRPTSPKAFVNMSKFLNEVSGGSDYRSGTLDFNPDNINYLFKFMIGGTGKFIDHTATTASGLIDQSEGKETKIKVNEIPFVRRFYGEPNPISDKMDYFDRKTEIQQLYNEYNNASEKDKKNTIYKGIEDIYYSIKDTDYDLKELSNQETENNKEKNEKNKIKNQNTIEEKESKAITEFNKEYYKYKRKLEDKKTPD